MRRRVVWLLAAALLAGAGFGEAAVKEQRVYLVKEYRFIPGTPAGDAEVGHALCGTRCNALSSDYLNFIEPGGWAMVRVAVDQEVRLPLDNPFLGGECLCVADEYLVKIDDLNAPKSFQ